jgi:hypothetical protein
LNINAGRVEYVSLGEEIRRCHVSEAVYGLQVGQNVPDFELTTYDPVKDDFGSVSLESLKSEGKWTILFFYPADFTFV